MVPPHALVQDFRAFLLTEGQADGRPYSPVTAEKMAEGVAWMLRQGLRPGRLEDGPEEAKREARRIMAKVREGHSRDAWNNRAKAMNALLRFHGHEYQVKLVRVARRKPPAFSAAERKALLAYRASDELTTQRRRALIQFAMTLGMRLGEIQALEDRDLDAEGARVFVRKPMKGGYQRWLPVPKELFHGRRPFGAWLANKPAHPDGAVWLNQHGERMGKSSLRRDCYCITKSTGVKFNFIRCRHTTNRRLRKGPEAGGRGMSLVYRQFYLGHADPRTTMVYDEIDEDDVRRDFIAHRPPSIFRKEGES